MQGLIQVVNQVVWAFQPYVQPNDSVIMLWPAFPTREVVCNREAGNTGPTAECKDISRVREESDLNSMESPATSDLRVPHSEMT